MRLRLAMAAMLSMVAGTLPAIASGEGPTGAWSVLTERFELAECAVGGTHGDRLREQAVHVETLGRVLKRAEPWVAYLAAEIVERDLPGELALIPIVESGYQAFARSRRKASGSWQLLETTARYKGLTISEQYDGRRDMLAATPAALDYLEDLHRRLDHNWHLAIQAYNAGPTRVRRLLRRQTHPVDAAQPLYASLPGETRAYHARLMELACLFSQPEDFGLDLPAVAMEPGFAIVELDEPIELAVIAAAAEIDPHELLALNAGLRGPTTPRHGPQRLIVPPQSAERVRRRLDRPEALPAATDDRVKAMARTLEALRDELLPERHYHHRVRPGDNLWVLSQRYSVPASAIRRNNGLAEDARLRPGQFIRIPPGPTTLPANQYRVQPGDTLWSIARDHGMSVRELVAINALSPDQPLMPGQIVTVAEQGCCDALFQALTP